MGRGRDREIEEGEVDELCDQVAGALQQVLRRVQHLEVRQPEHLKLAHITNMAHVRQSRPDSGPYGTCKTVNARFRPWLAPSSRMR